MFKTYQAHNGSSHCSPVPEGGRGDKTLQTQSNETQPTLEGTPVGDIVLQVVGARGPRRLRRAGPAVGKTAAVGVVISRAWQHAHSQLHRMPSHHALSLVAAALRVCIHPACRQ